MSYADRSTQNVSWCVNPFVVPRFIGAIQRNPAKDRMNAVTTNCF